MTQIAPAAPPIVEFHQHDWISGFAAFRPDATTPEPDSRAFCVVNLGAFLATIETAAMSPADLPYLVVESMLHELGHVLEQWADTEFSERRIEALLERYRQARHARADASPGPTSEARQPDLAAVTAKSAERRQLYVDLQMMVAGHGVETVIAALSDSLASSIGFASHDLASAGSLLDGLVPDIKAAMRDNWDYLSEVKASATGEVGRA